MTFVTPWRKTTNSPPGTRIETSIGRRNIFVDQNGKIVFEHTGEGQYDEMEQLVKKLLDHNS